MELIFFVIILISIIQSIFGVGVLLFGTPILLILDYKFIEALNILLPISVAINFLQIINGHKKINFNYYKQLLIFSIPPIIILLWITVEVNINSEFFIGLFLLFISLKSFFASISKLITSMFRFQKTFLVFQGIIHGATNLGGSLLTSNIFALNLGKDETRATVSLSYLTFAIFQLVTLIFLGKFEQIRLDLIILGILIFFIFDLLVYKKISNSNYDKIFAIFLFLSGLTLVFKGVI